MRALLVDIGAGAHAGLEEHSPSSTARLWRVTQPRGAAQDGEGDGVSEGGARGADAERWVTQAAQVLPHSECLDIVPSHLAWLGVSLTSSVDSTVGVVLVVHIRVHLQCERKVEVRT